MRTTVTQAALDVKGNDVALVRDILRAAIDESGWKHEAVACALGVCPAFLSRMLSGEKPIAAKHLRALPDDIEAVFARRYAESFGLLVVVPADADQALTSFVSGLAGLLGAKVPRLGKAEIRETAHAGAA